MRIILNGGSFGHLEVQEQFFHIQFSYDRSRFILLLESIPKQFRLGLKLHHRGYDGGRCCLGDDDDNTVFVLLSKVWSREQRLRLLLKLMTVVQIRLRCCWLLLRMTLLQRKTLLLLLVRC